MGVRFLYHRHSQVTLSTSLHVHLRVGAQDGLLRRNMGRVFLRPTQHTPSSVGYQSVVVPGRVSMVASFLRRNVRVSSLYVTIYQGKRRVAMVALFRTGESVGVWFRFLFVREVDLRPISVHS